MPLLRLLALSLDQHVYVRPIAIITEEVVVDRRAKGPDLQRGGTLLCIYALCTPL